MGCVIYVKFTLQNTKLSTILIDLNKYYHLPSDNFFQLVQPKLKNRIVEVIKV